MNTALRRAFTLVELLVVVAIIVILIAILIPSLERAYEVALKAKCMANERTMNLATQQYSLEQKGFYPPVEMSGQGQASAYDLRAQWDANPGNLYPMALGLVVEAQLLPSTQLGKVVHCPVFQNLGNPAASGHNMDVQHAWGVGASWWNEIKAISPPTAHRSRVIMGYDYRPASWHYVNGPMQRKDAGSSRVIFTDLLSVNVVGTRRVYAHREGYALQFGDGSGIFHNDPNYSVEAFVIANSGGGVGGLPGSAANEEKVYEYLSTPH